MESKFIHFFILSGLNFLLTLKDTFISMFVLLCFMLTFIQMSKILKKECNAINTTNKKNLITVW